MVLGDKFFERDSLVNWDFPPIYDIHPNKEYLLEDINFLVDIIKVVEVNDVHCMFEESSKTEKS